MIYVKKIIIAGAGHGGLVAAYHLAKNGCDVTVIEKRKRADMGHDWHDWMVDNVFEKSDIPRPPEEIIYRGEDQSFRNPSGSVNIDVELEDGAIVMDRKELINYLIAIAEEAGVKFEFDSEIIAPHTEGKAVKGIIVRKPRSVKLIESDLLIDSAGMYSPVRSKLPAVFGIDNTIDRRSVFHVYRAYFENTDGTVNKPPYTINMFHMYRPGLDWTITTEDYVDVLLGKFSQSGELTQEEIDAAIASFREDYPFIGEKIVRGGCKADIPISRMLALLVADGYAAIGDAAGMTMPLNGSGIVLSMEAGKILADTVLTADGDYSAGRLWNYEYEYYNQYGKDLVVIDIIKTVFTYVGGDVVDYIFEKGIMNKEMLGIANGNDVKLTPEYILNAIKSAPPLLKYVPAVAKCAKTVPLVSAVSAKMPKEYDEKKVARWIKAYKAL